MRLTFTSLSKLLTLLVVLISAVGVQAQEVSPTFKILNSRGEPIAFATITVKNRLDSNVVQKKIADSLGTASFVLIPNAQYVVTITSATHQPLEKGITMSSGQREFRFQLDDLKTLGNVVVRSSRPLMRQEDDKTIVDPENLASTSTSGFEVIEKVPGLFVDQDGNIYIASTTPATILINGREIKMSAAD